MNKFPEIPWGAMFGGKYYDSENKDISQVYMNAESWQGKIMGLEGGVKARANAKRGNDTKVSEDGRASAADSDASSNAEDAGATQDTPPPDTNQTGDARAQDE